MAIVTMKQLLESGVHFGHQTRDWNPRMEPYIYTSRNKIHIINLEKTVDLVRDAYNFVRDKVAEGGEVLFVCTKKQGSDIIQEEAERCGMHYVKYRWWGGMLTNFETISKSIERLKELERQEESGLIATLSKKEKSRLMKERSRLERGLSGIKEMNRPPDVMVVIDADLEEIAIAEARKLKIPVVALLDTNCNPEDIDYIIPGNDDAIRSIKLIGSIIADAVLEGKNLKSSAKKEAEKAQPAEEEDKSEKAGENKKEKKKPAKKAEPKKEKETKVEEKSTAKVESVKESKEKLEKETVPEEEVNTKAPKAEEKEIEEEKKETKKEDSKEKIKDE